MLCAALISQYELHHRSGDLEIYIEYASDNSYLHHRSGDLEIVFGSGAILLFLHHRSGDLENLMI